MRCYLFGPNGPEQLATHRLLKERGYDVICSTQLGEQAMKRYGSGPGLMPAHKRYMHLQMQEILAASVVIIEEDTPPEALAHLQHICRFVGNLLVWYNDLPILCPDRLLDMEHCDLAHDEMGPVKQRLRRHAKSARRRMERWAQRFNGSWGWFFTNGNKQREYSTTPIPPTVTA
jgi:hypothetical protein